MDESARPGTNLPTREIYTPPERVREGGILRSRAEYEELYQRSITDRDGFWGEMALRHLDWTVPFEQVVDEDLTVGRVTWFQGGHLNVAHNCLDRHLPERGDRTAILWEGDEPGENRSLTYHELFGEVCRLASALRARGIGRGDRVAIYMGMVPELAVAMLACARIGAVHSVIFGGFSPRAIATRVDDAECRAIITQDEGRRGGRSVRLKRNVDEALQLGCESIEFSIVFRRTGAPIELEPNRDFWWHDVVAAQPEACEPAAMKSEDSLFILYTSGSTGPPKGVLHTQAGYLLYAMLSQRYVFDLRDDDIFFCTADIGWITGHTYAVYGPLANGTTTVLFESVPTYPDPGRLWDVVDRLGATILYTAPTALRALMAEGDSYVQRYGRQTLRVLGSVGEPINPEAWRWYFNVVGEGRCAIVDTYWQTETGGFLITGFASALDMKPGAGALPFFGIEPFIVDEQGDEVAGPDVAGRLCVRRSWPGMMRTVWGNHDRFVRAYLETVPGAYFTEDGCYRDEDGYYWITGRVDDLLNVSGHRLSTAEIEGALAGHEACAEAAVVGYPHEVKGTGIYAFVVLRSGLALSPDLIASMRTFIRGEIGPIAVPDRIQVVTALPKTRSGKVMRRILRKVAAGEDEDFGDTTTLADPAVVAEIVAGFAEAA